MRHYSRALLAFVASAAIAGGQNSQLRFAIAADPKTFDPLLATDAVSESIRYLTSGVLIRFNRSTQKLQPELCESWEVLENNRKIVFHLRGHVKFSDGSSFGPADVVATIRRMMTPDIESGIADTFRASGGEMAASQTGPNSVTVHFSTPVAGLEILFDQLAIESSHRSETNRAVLGPFVVADHKGGQYVLLQRNPYYWKTGSDGVKLPRLDSVKMEVQSNREVELLRYRRGELQLVDQLEPAAFDRLSRDPKGGARNAGVSLDTEFLWFNQSPDAKLPAPMRTWFGSANFRRAISAAINRDDIVRLVYKGYAHAASSPVSPGNTLWFNTGLTPPRQDRELAAGLLKADGFHLDSGVLRDRRGNPVEFSLITNSGSKTRTLMGTIVQQDLAKIGIRLNLQPLEFQSLIERITKTQQYEACLLGFSNVEIDPNSQMNIWMSSGVLHPWSPKQTNPATPWEAEIDRMMQAQHTASNPAARKKAFDRVQAILAEQQPAVFLVHPDVLVAVSPAVRGAAPSALPPHLDWNIEYLSLDQR